MKIRSGFVSNSSSSSFIVIKPKTTDNYPNYPEHLIVDSSFGETEFGWGPERIDLSGSKIIFAYLQTQYASEPEWLKMLEDAIRNNCGVKTIEWKLTTQYGEDDLDHAYIDHQSHAGEGENTEMFDSEENLKNFLFNAASFIMLDNDNY
jgi:hypothetical protein